MSSEVGSREHPGVRKSVRRSYHDWMFLDRDPEEMAKSGPPPVGVESWMKDVFGERAKTLKMAMHPHLKRWALYERHLDPEKGEELWQCIWLCSDAPEEGKVPKDYQGDRFLASFGRFIGEFRLPNKQDFEEIEQGDRKKYGVDTVCEMFDKRENAEQIEADRVFRDYTDDFLSYYFNLAVNEANREAGSGWKMQSYATVGHKCDPNKWYNTEREGYNLRVRKGTRAHFIVKMEELLRSKGRLSSEVGINEYLDSQVAKEQEAEWVQDVADEKTEQKKIEELVRKRAALAAITAQSVGRMKSL